MISDWLLSAQSPRRQHHRASQRRGCHLSREYLTLQKWNSWNSCLCSWEANFQDHGLRHLLVVCVSIPHRFVLSQLPGLSPCLRHIDNCTSASCENICRWDWPPDLMLPISAPLSMQHFATCFHSLHLKTLTYNNSRSIQKYPGLETSGQNSGISCSSRVTSWSPTIL